MINIFSNIGIDDKDIYLGILKSSIESGDLRISKKFEKLYLTWFEKL